MTLSKSGEAMEVAEPPLKKARILSIDHAGFNAKVLDPKTLKEVVVPLAPGPNGRAEALLGTMLASQPIASS